MKRKLLYTLMFSSVLVLTACGGGGGGGGGGSPGNPGNPYLRSEVPFSTPVLAAVVAPLATVASDYVVAESYTANIENTGGQNIIIAGRETQPSSIPNWTDSKISMLGWSGGQLVDKTAQWFPNNSNIILGTDPTVQFVDFFNSGKTDMFVAPSTDMQHYGPAYIFENKGTYFDRQAITMKGWVNVGSALAPAYVLRTNIDTVWGHGATVADLNNDGYKDFVVVDYGPNTTIGINRMSESTPVKGFNTYVSANATGDLRYGGSSVAVADFLGNGEKQLVITDAARTPGSAILAPTKMYSYNINGSGQLTYTYLNTLPTPRFELSKYSSYNFGASHNVLGLTFNMATGAPNSGNDLLIFSTPSDISYKLSEIQFLKNNGTGTFTDVTDATLVGYNTNTYTTYNPKFVDLNGDGLTDILVSSGDNSGASNSTQFLMRSSDGKYVAAYQNLLSDFTKQVSSLSGTTGNDVNVVKDANGKLYLVSMTSYVSNGNRQQGIYLSALGNQSVTTAQTAVNLIRQTWPYMTDVQANQALAMTSSTYMTDAGVGRIIDMNAAMNPVGPLGLPSRSGSIMPIGGFLSGIQLDDHSAVAMDSIGKSYNINLKSLTGNTLNAFQYNTQSIDTHELTSHAEYLLSGPTITSNGLRIGSDVKNFTDPAAIGNNLNKQSQYTVGVPELYRNGNLSYGVQYTSLNSNPWMAMSGSWGTVNNSGILDNVVSYRSNGFSATGSLMNVSTNITPGLVNNVSNITGYWGETGYRYTDMSKDGIGDLGFYVGVKPVVLSGSAQVNMPTGVDNNGNTLYTNKNYNIAGDVTPYIRSMYVYPIEKNTHYRLSGIAMPNGQYRLMNEIRWFLP